jgi:hypothetical protein
LFKAVKFIIIEGAIICPDRIRVSTGPKAPGRPGPYAITATHKKVPFVRHYRRVAIRASNACIEPKSPVASPAGWQVIPEIMTELKETRKLYTFDTIILEIGRYQASQVEQSSSGFSINPVITSLFYLATRIIIECIRSINAGIKSTLKASFQVASLSFQRIQRNPESI